MKQRTVSMTKVMVIKNLQVERIHYDMNTEPQTTIRDLKNAAQTVIEKTFH